MLTQLRLHADYSLFAGNCTINREKSQEIKQNGMLIYCKNGKGAAYGLPSALEYNLNKKHIKYGACTDRKQAVSFP